MEEKKSQCQIQIPSLPTKILSESIQFITETLTFLSSLSSNPLFSIFITFYTLILLYFPKLFLNLIFSPILISTLLLLSTLIRLGSSNSTRIAQKQEFQFNPEAESVQWISCGTEIAIESDKFDNKSWKEEEKTMFTEPFVEWNVRAPLEVIYEGEKGEEEDGYEKKEEMGIDKMVSFSIYYPESDTGSSSGGDFPEIEEWDSPKRVSFRWDEEDKDDGLIEIELDGKGDLNYQFEEENLIEIDISPM